MGVAVLFLMLGIFGCQKKITDETEEPEVETQVIETEFETQQSRYDVTLDELNCVEKRLGSNEELWIESKGEFWLLKERPDYDAALYGIHEDDETFLFLRVADSVYQLSVEWKSYSLFDMYVNDFDDDGEIEYELIAIRSEMCIRDIFMIEMQSSGEMCFHKFSGDKILEYVNIRLEKMGYEAARSFHVARHGYFSGEKNGMIALFDFTDEKDGQCEYAVQLIYTQDGCFAIGDSILETHMLVG